MVTGELFQSPDFRPLAERLRPQNIDDFVGQTHILGKQSPLRQSIVSNNVHSMILWGPPGCGKTTLANLLGQCQGYHLVKLSAVMATVKDVRTAVDEAKKRAQSQQLKTILFLDEVHRFNKAQQDAFLPFIEDGTLIFVGATTENPSFSLNNALLSRTRLYVFKRLENDDLAQLATRAFSELNLTLEAGVLDDLLLAADGDGRRLINIIDSTVAMKDAANCDFATALKLSFENQLKRFDNKGDDFYDLISALQKCIRGSNPHAALYYFCRMIEGGGGYCLYFTAFDHHCIRNIGNADPRALSVAIDGWQAFERIGAPQGYINVAQVINYLACAPKSNASYNALNQAMADVKNNQSYPVPNHLVNAPTQLMKTLEKGKGYRYAHNEPHAYAAGETYFPAEMGEREYYLPNERGLEIKIKDKLEFLKQLDKESKKGNSNK